MIFENMKKYQIVKEIGKGGMARVYQVKDTNLNIMRVMKVVRVDAVDDNNRSKQVAMSERLKHEAAILKNVDHPLILRIIEIFQFEEGIAMVTELVNGMTLSEWVTINGALKEVEAIAIGIQLSDVLSYLHSLQPGVLYGDLKPDNIMIRSDGTIKVIDFGAVNEIHNSAKPGKKYFSTYGYVAPEILRNGLIDERSDIYSLGMTLYYMVTYGNPGTLMGEIRPIRQVNPTLSSGLEKIILKCTKESSGERYQSSLECRYDLEHHKRMSITEKHREFFCKFLGFTGIFFSIVFCIMGIYQSFTSCITIAERTAGCSACLAMIQLFLLRFDKVKRKKENYLIKREKNVICTEKDTEGLYV